MQVSKRIKIIQLAGEIAIPLLGYFWWGWSYYFLLLFYLLDLLANTAMHYVKIKKVKEYQGQNKEGNFFFSLKMGSLLLGIVGLGAGFITQIHPDFDFWSETKRFIMLRDMGLPQGIFLVPLVIYAAYLNYKMTFLLPQRFRTTSIKQLNSDYFTGLYLVLAGFGLGLGISFFYVFPEIINVLVTALGIGFYSYFRKK